MLARIPFIILLITLINATASLLMERLYDPIFLYENPLIMAEKFLREERMEEVLHLVHFSQQYLPVDPEYSAFEMEKQANQLLNSHWYLMEHFATGALTGEVSDTAGLVGALSIDLLLIGDIRDLIIQGYKEFDSGQGDETIMALSATGLLLAMMPELSWAPSLFKTFWRGNRFSPSFQKQLSNATRQAQKSGDMKVLRLMFGSLSTVVESLGTGPAMAIMKRVDTVDDLALLARKAKIAPLETYTLTRINGIRALQDISVTSTKQGKLVSKVKLAARQQKVFAKALGLIPVFWLLLIIIVCPVLLYVLIKTGRKTV